METVLVTGGCGFIGSHFIRYLLNVEPSVRVVNLDALTYAGSPANVADLDQHPNYRFHYGDVADPADARDAIAGASSVINFAAESHVDRSIRNSGPFIRTNVIGTQVLLDAARAAGVHRFIQVSTDEVYGSLGPAEPRFTEDRALAPKNPYAASKAAADLLVQSYVNTYDLPAIITRCSNNYGTHQYPEKLIPLFIERLLRNEPVPIYGDGLHIRDWIHVLDHCAGVRRAWRRGRPGEVYNFGGECERTIAEVASLLLLIMGKPDSLLTHVADRPGNDRRYGMDCSKAARELDWLPIIEFASGLADTVRWHHAQYGGRAGLSAAVSQTSVSGLPGVCDSEMSRS